MVVALITKEPQLKYNILNNRNAWLKLASSVYIIGEDTKVDFATKDKKFEPKSIRCQ